jgi:hypothetical protein
MARPVGINYDGIAPLTARSVWRRPDKAKQLKPQESKPRANEMPFVIPASELRDRKKQRRNKRP